MFTAVLAAIWVAVMIALARRALRRGRAARPTRSRVDPARRAAHELRRRGAGGRDRRDRAGADRRSATSRSATSSASRSEAVTITHHRAPVVVGGPLRGRRRRAAASRPRTRSTSRSAGRCRSSSTSADVIHSFWVPSLMGKQDLIPGQENDIRFVADRPGIYRGQCAEFCGLQHAHMGSSSSPSRRGEFDAWRDAQIAVRRSAPTTPSGRTGHAGLPVAGPASCATRSAARRPAGGVAPDLTHVGSRRIDRRRHAAD